ncbi:MAG: shikimate dehydrogenase [Verrucomicrobiota bacterium]|nr:shikimate dehydrogenase [Verrucomicrobiota bacterium]
MSEELNFLHNITGSFAQPAAENPTVEMVEAAYRHHGLHYRYLNTEVPPEKLADAVAGARAMNWAGFNCSIPHKVAVIEHLDGLGESASVIGAVNCAVRRDGQYIGENTDGKGFLKSLQEVVDPAGKTIVMFGAGGAARAIGVECALAGATHITVVNRSEDRGNELTTLLKEKTPVEAVFGKWDGDYRVGEGVDVVINATSIGLADAHAKIALDLDSLTQNMVVADVIPNPPRTRLVHDAEAKGCTVIDGLGMLVNQGITGIEYWTGETVDGNVMRSRLEELFGD